jgi:hypothetical protein
MSVVLRLIGRRERPGSALDVNALDVQRNGTRHFEQNARIGNFHQQVTVDLLSWQVTGESMGAASVV